MSLVGALTPLGKVATRRSAWVAHVTAYTLAGTLSSVAVGAGLGALGATVLAPGLDAPRLAALVLLTALAALQVSGVLRQIHVAGLVWMLLALAAMLIMRSQ